MSILNVLFNCPSSGLETLTSIGRQSFVYMYRRARGDERGSTPLESVLPPSISQLSYGGENTNHVLTISYKKEESTILLSFPLSFKRVLIKAQ